MTASTKSRKRAPKKKPAIKTTTSRKKVLTDTIQNNIQLREKTMEAMEALKYSVNRIEQLKGQRYILVGAVVVEAAIIATLVTVGILTGAITL